MDLVMRAKLRMMSLASPLTDRRVAHGTRDPRYADMVTSMCDLRAALNLALGVPADNIGGLGYPDLDWTRAQRAAKDVRHAT